MHDLAARFGAAASRDVYEFLKRNIIQESSHGTSGYARQACVLLPARLDKYADASTTSSYSAVKMIKKGIGWPIGLRCRNTYRNALSRTRLPLPPVLESILNPFPLSRPISSFLSRRFCRESSPLPRLYL